MYILILTSVFSDSSECTEVFGMDIDNVCFACMAGHMKQFNR